MRRASPPACGDQLVERPRSETRWRAPPSPRSRSASARAADRAQRGLAERLEPHHPAARQERRDHLERGVLGGRADEGDGAGLDVGQERVLLGAREAVDLVHEQERARCGAGRAARPPPATASRTSLTPALTAETVTKWARSRPAEQARQCSLAGARGSPQQQGWESPPSAIPASSLPGAEQVLLTDELVERAGRIRSASG